jgi:hypothetical protein
MRMRELKRKYKKELMEKNIQIAKLNNIIRFRTNPPINRGDICVGTMDFTLKCDPYIYIEDKDLLKVVLNIQGNKERIGYKYIIDRKYIKDELTYPDNIKKIVGFMIEKIIQELNK